MSSEENKAVVRRFNEEAWNRHNLAVMDELFAPDYVAHFAGSPPLDRAGHKQFNAALLAAFPDVQSTTEDLLAEGDKVVWRWTAWGTHRGPFQGLPPTGKPFTLTGISILRLAGGQIVEHWAEFDALGMLQQLGALPAPGQPGA